MDKPNQASDPETIQETATQVSAPAPTPVAPPSPAPAPSSEPAASPNSNTDSYAIITAVSPLIGMLIGGFPGLNIIAPLICWLIWKQDYPLVDQVGKNVLNSQISWGIYLFVSYTVFGLLTLIFIGYVFIWIIPVIWIILSIVNAVKIANKDYKCQMPFTIKFIK